MRQGGFCGPAKGNAHWRDTDSVDMTISLSTLGYSGKSQVSSVTVYEFANLPAEHFLKQKQLPALACSRGGKFFIPSMKVPVRPEQ